MDPLQPKHVLRTSPSLPAQAGTDAGGVGNDGPPPDFVGLALWMAGTLAGVVTAALVGQAPVFRALARRMGWAGQNDPGKAARAADANNPSGEKNADKPTPEEALPMLADAIVGNSKSAVARVFGPPRSSVISPETPVPALATFWQANTWYYPLPRNGRLAMAIEFEEDLAREVIFFRAPGL